MRHDHDKDVYRWSPPAVGAPASIGVDMTRGGSKVGLPRRRMAASDLPAESFVAAAGDAKSPGVIRPLARTTLPVEIVNAIADLMTRGIWRPGDLLPSEKQLAEHFGVGRSTIREAVKSLVVIGAIEQRAGEGSFIREPTSQLVSGAFRWGLLLGKRNVDDLIDVRILVECTSVARVAAKAGDEDIAKLQGIMGAMVDNAARQSDFMKHDNAFHETIADIEGNVLLKNISSLIQSMVSVWFPPTFYQTDTTRLTIEEHGAILKGITGRDPEAASDAMRSHIVHAAERLRKATETS